LKFLPEQRQAEIIEYIHTHTLAATVKWLEAAGISVSRMTVSRFVQWTQFRDFAFQCCDSIEIMLREIKSQHPDITQDKLDSIGQMMFTTLAIRLQDPLAWKRVQEVRLKHKSLALEERKVKVLEQNQSPDPADADSSTEKMSPQEMEAEYKRIFGRTG
jgi:hypothetical protein